MRRDSLFFVAIRRDSKLSGGFVVFGLAKRRLNELRGKTPFEQMEAPCEELQNKSVEISYLNKENIIVNYVHELRSLSDSLNLLLNSSSTLGLDIETYGSPEFVGDKQAGLQPRKSIIRTVQIYDGTTSVYVFDLLKLGGLSVLGEEIWERPFIAHNAMFELKHLLHKGANPKRLGCTLLADRVITGNRKELREGLGLSTSAGLKDLTKDILGVDISKEQQTSDWSQETLSPEQIEYAALDAVLVIKLFEIQKKSIGQLKLARSYQILRDAQYASAKMELWWIGFDVPKHKSLIESWHLERDALKETILAAIGHELNLNSGKQVGEWLNEALKQKDLDSWAKTAKGQLSTSTHTFKLNERMHDIFPKIVEYRHIAKRISSFGEGMYAFMDASACRLYGSFSLGATTTGRMASFKPNMQNMPRNNFRNLFCAREGCVLIGLDYSQQELRVAALVANDEELLRVYEKGEDAHITTAAMVLKIPKENVIKEHRQLAKALNFGLLYGQGAPGLAAYSKQNYGVNMTVEQAEQHRNAFFKIYKGLRAWQKQTGKLTEITKKAYTPCGRIRDFSKEKRGYSYTAALNLPIQGGAAEITLNALSRLTEVLNDECRLVNVVHDEVILEVVESKADAYAAKAKEAMEQAFLDVFPNAGPYMKELVEAKIGKNWAETK
jgi:DNA polymerase-1